MDLMELISKVQLNAPIWDKRLKSHANRNVVDSCWRRVSSEMNIEDVVLRKKWKYLRDQFSVEYSKLNTPRSGDAAETATEPKWAFFKQLLFLKDVVRPRASSNNLKTKPSSTATDPLVGTEEQEDAFADEDIPSPCPDHEFVEVENMTGKSANPLPRRPKRARAMTAHAYYEKMLLLKEQQIYTMQTALLRPHQENENDDLFFFKSLLPFVTKIPLERKLKLRCRINEVVEEFLKDEQLPYLSNNSHSFKLSPTNSLDSSGS